MFSGFDPLQGRKGELVSLDLGPNSGYYSTVFDTFWDISPDGSRIAFGGCEPQGGHIRILDLDRHHENLIGLKDWSCLTSVGWSPDGKSLFVTNWASRGGSILHVALNGETRLLHKAIGMELERPVPSPDGRYLAYGEVTTVSNAWLLERAH